jgi:hypothetical protein
MRKKYTRADLGKGVRGKYLSDYLAGGNLVLLRPEVAAVYPTAEAVNNALLGLIKAGKTKSKVGHATRTRTKLRAG